MSFNRLIIIVLTFCLFSCKDPGTDLIFEKYNLLAKELKISPLKVSVNKTEDSRTGKKKEIILDFSPNADIAPYYQQDAYWLQGKIAYEMFDFLIKNKKSGDFDKISVIASVNGATAIMTFTNHQLTTMVNSVKVTDSFFLSLNEGINTIKKYNDREYFKDSLYLGFIGNIKEKKLNEGIHKNYVVGLTFDQITGTKDNLIVVERFLKRQKSNELIRFYILEKNYKMVDIRIISNGVDWNIYP